MKRKSPGKVSIASKTKQKKTRNLSKTRFRAVEATDEAIVPKLFQIEQKKVGSQAAMFELSWSTIDCVSTTAEGKRFVSNLMQHLLEEADSLNAMEEISELNKSISTEIESNNKRLEAAVLQELKWDLSMYSDFINRWVTGVQIETIPPTEQEFLDRLTNTIQQRVTDMKQENLTMIANLLVNKLLVKKFKIEFPKYQIHLLNFEGLREELENELKKQKLPQIEEFGSKWFTEFGSEIERILRDKNNIEQKQQLDQMVKRMCNQNRLDKQQWNECKDIKGSSITGTQVQGDRLEIGTLRAVKMKD